MLKGWTNDITCVGNDFDVDSTSCEGDSGSPVIRRISGTARVEPYYQQEYVVSTGLDCALRATIYARVSNREILTWIQQTTNTSPLVAIIGGFTDFAYKKKKLVPREAIGQRSGPTNEIEIISPDKKCRVGMKPNILAYKICDANCFGSDDPNFKPYKFNDAEVIGHTGQFTNDAPIYCGGEAKKGNLAECYEYNYRSNR